MDPSNTECRVHARFDRPPLPRPASRHITRQHGVFTPASGPSSPSQPPKLLRSTTRAHRSMYIRAGDHDGGRGLARDPRVNTAQAAVYLPRSSFLNLSVFLMRAWFTMVRKLGEVVL